MKVRFHGVPAAVLLSVTLWASTPALAQQTRAVAVPQQVAGLVRPILDVLQTNDAGPARDRLVSEQFYALMRKRGRFADEALVVLLCFAVMGESQEDEDAVISRGRKMLPYLEKYRSGKPIISGRSYPDSMLKGYSQKRDDFEGASQAIRHGWRGTGDNPQG